jgi:hypothetical protein
MKGYYDFYNKNLLFKNKTTGEKFESKDIILPLTTPIVYLIRTIFFVMLSEVEASSVINL